MNPRAKRNGVLSEQVDDEILVYDREADRAHCLNRTAALVWRHADGERTIADLAAILRDQLDPVADENLVWHALDRLNESALLEEPQPRSPEEMRAARRQFISKVGLVGIATLLLPIVTSMAAPAPAQAGASGGSCGSSGGFSNLLAEWLAREQ
jgi:hypothetical protein